MTAGATGTRGSRPGELHRRRVLLLAESAGLAAVLHHLLDPADRLTRIGSLHELAETRVLESADVVVLDVAADGRAGAVAQIRHRYPGPLVVLAARGEDVGGLRLDDAATLLTRPFSADDLAAALARPGGSLPAGRWAPEPTGEGVAAPGRRTTAARAREVGLVELGQRLLVDLTEGWRTRRPVRVAGFSAFALVAFTVAFVLAAQGRCGSGCDALGIGFSPRPTIAGQSSVPSTSGPKRSTTTTVAAGSPGTGAFSGITGSRAAATTTTERATTTTRRVVATTRPATTRPATTKPTIPPTTAPPTTSPPTTAPPTTGGA